MAKHFAPGAQLPPDAEDDATGAMSESKAGEGTSAEPPRPAARFAPADPAMPAEPPRSAGRFAPEQPIAPVEPPKRASRFAPVNRPAPGDAPQPRRRKRHRALKILGVVVLVLALAAGGAAFAIQRSIERGRQAFQDSMQKKVDENVNTVQYDGHSYALNEHMVTVAFIGFDNRTTNMTSGNEVEGQSDAIIVMALDTDTGKVTAIVVPRDSMVPVDMYVSGNYAGQATMQICLQYSYGSSPEDSSQLVASCVSRVLDGIPIDYCFTLNIEGVSPINDSIGGVTVVPTQSVDKAGIVEGQETTLMGDEAEAYVQYRDTDDPNSSLERQARQVSYLKAFMAKVLQAAKSNPGMLLDLYNTALNYTWTNLGVDEFSYLASTMLGKGVGSVDVTSLKGEMGSKDNHAAFTLDQDDVQRTVIDTFYHQVDTDTATASGTAATAATDSGAAGAASTDANASAAADSGTNAAAATE